MDDHKKKLEELHKKSVEKFDEYIKMKGKLGEQDHKKLHEAKDEWQNAWNRLMEVLLVLERLEI